MRGSLRECWRWRLMSGLKVCFGDVSVYRLRGVRGCVLRLLSGTVCGEVFRILLPICAWFVDGN